MSQTNEATKTETTNEITARGMLKVEVRNALDTLARFPEHIQRLGEIGAFAHHGEKTFEAQAIVQILSARATDEQTEARCRDLLMKDAYLFNYDFAKAAERRAARRVLEIYAAIHAEESKTAK